MSEKRKEIGKCLAARRAISGKSRDDISSSIGVCRETYAKWERGETSIPTDKMWELADIYEVSLDEMVGFISVN